MYLEMVRLADDSDGDDGYDEEDGDIAEWL